jgi:pilus assembly protein CpaB
MFLRNVLLAVGAVFVLAGVGLMIAWFGQVKNTPTAVESQVQGQQQVLVAARAIPDGQTLEMADISRKDVGPGEVQPGNRLVGQEAEFLGKRSLRNFIQGEPLIASDFVSGDRLSARLKPGHRAVSIFVDAPQSVAGLALPGDHVDVILTQSFADSVTTDPGRRTVGETVLRDVGVIAVDQSMTPQSNVPSMLSTVSADSRIPKTVTLELTEWQAEVLLVAAQLGKLQLAVRPLETAGVARDDDKHVHVVRTEDKGEGQPAWASRVSPALDEIAQPLKQVSVRIYSGQPRSDGYLCSISACGPSDVNTVPRY